MVEFSKIFFFLQVSCYLEYFSPRRCKKRLCRFRKSGEGTFQTMNITLLLCPLIILLSPILLQSCSQSFLCRSLTIFLSHSDIYFSREGLLGSKTVLLWNHQFISIGCWASFPRAKRGQMSRSKINNTESASCSLSTIANDPAQVTAKFLCALEQHHPPMKALISSHRQWDHTWVRHRPYPEHLLYLLSDCTVTLLPDRLLVHAHASSPHQYSCIDFICLVFIISWIFLTHSLWLEDAAGLYTRTESECINYQPTAASYWFAAPLHNPHLSSFKA